MMKQGENFKRKKLPTMQQLSYLLELYRMDAGTGAKGVVEKVAKACGVSHSSVSRYLKSCRENGLLTEKYTFTRLGKARVEGYRKIIEGLTVYFKMMGLPEEDVKENVRNQIENVEFHVLMSMVKNMNRQPRREGAERIERLRKNFPLEIFEKGDWEVYFILLHLPEGGQTGLSMADRGFEKPALLHLSGEESCLELTVCEMSARSRVDGERMTGCLDSLKYARDGILCQAEIKNGKVRIPLDAFRFHRKKGGEMWGMIPVTATCDVGRAHMPESTAVLVFWM